MQGVDLGHASKQKSGLLAWGLRSRAEPKVDKKRGNVSFLSTGHSEIGERGSESRQKTGEMSDFCLPASPNSARAVPKVDKKRGNI